jgi:S-adenosylmethionine:tRNA ribosyltransferase-isomerase
LKTSDFDYDLPIEFIAQKPIEARDSSRLMVLDRKNGLINHSTFKNIGEYLKPGDLLVINETRVIPARLYASKLPGGGKVEILLLKKKDSSTWEVMVGGKGLKEGDQV